MKREEPEKAEKIIAVVECCIFSNNFDTLPINTITKITINLDLSIKC